MKKTLCLLLSAIMILSAIPFVAMGASTLIGIELLGLTAPSENAEPNYYITDNDADYEVTDVVWFDHESGTDMQPGDKFLAGHSYRVQIYVEPQNGFVFRTDGASGKPAVIVSFNREGNEDALVYGDAEKILIQIDYPAFESKLIREVEITGIERPLAGRIPDCDGVVSAESYKIDDEGIASIEWYDITNGEGASVMPANEKFVAGHKYRVAIWLRAINGYSFITDDEVKVTIDGLKGDHYSESSVVAYVGYDFEHVCDIKEVAAKKATLSDDGNIAHYKCDGCNKLFADENATQEITDVTVSRINSITLSTEFYTYNGKNKTPKVTIKDAEGNTLTKNTDYKLTVASKRSGIGRYTVKVTFIGNYEGAKNVFFYILPGKPASVKSASQTTSSVTLSWSAVPGAAGYTVYRYSPSKKAYVKSGTTEGTSLTVKSLYSGTKYTFRVVAYGKTSAGKVYDSKTYALLKTATKTKTPELTKVTASSATKGKAYVYHTDVSGETGYTVYYSTKSNSGFKKYANFKADTTRCDITGLKSGTTYYFKVRTYITTNSGYVYSPWTAVKSIKVN